MDCIISPVCVYFTVEEVCLVLYVSCTLHVWRCISVYLWTWSSESHKANSIVSPEPAGGAEAVHQSEHVLHMQTNTLAHFLATAELCDGMPRAMMMSQTCRRVGVKGRDGWEIRSSGSVPCGTRVELTHITPFKVCRSESCEEVDSTRLCGTFFLRCCCPLGMINPEELNIEEKKK